MNTYLNDNGTRLIELEEAIMNQPFLPRFRHAMLEKMVKEQYYDSCKLGNAMQFLNGLKDYLPSETITDMLLFFDLGSTITPELYKLVYPLVLDTLSGYSNYIFQGFYRRYMTIVELSIKQSGRLLALRYCWLKPAEPWDDKRFIYPFVSEFVEQYDIEEELLLELYQYGMGGYHSGLRKQLFWTIGTDGQLSSSRPFIKDKDLTV